MGQYEIAFLAIASKNKLMTHEEADACLREFETQAEGARVSLEDLIKEKGILSSEQLRLLSAAAKRVAGGGVSRPSSSSAAVPVAAGEPPKAISAPVSPPVAARAPVSPPAAPIRPPPPRPAGPAGPNEPIPGVRIVGKLGVGGTATVFVADDTRFSRKVALKIMHPSLARDEKAMRRFQREASLLIDFDHPTIVKGYDRGMMGPLAYFLMEYLEGESAQEVLDREKHLSEARALEIIMETADAIDYMQSKGIVHRDIKPGNIFVSKDGRVKVLDLGFAQEISGGGDPGEEETTSGTAQYMSPEQARGQRDIDVRADIYSLGATLYHMVMGELPFSGGDSLEVMAKQVMEALSSAGMKNRRISKHMHYFIERMMSKDKDLRYSTPRELVEDINEQLDGFKSLEYKPDETQAQSSAMKFMDRPPTTRIPRAGTRPIPRPPTTRKFGRPDGGSRFRKR